MNAKELIQQQIEQRGIAAVLADISEVYGDMVAIAPNLDAFRDEELVAAKAVARQVKNTWEFAREFAPRLSLWNS